MSETAAPPPPAARALRIVLRYRLMALRHRLSGLLVRGHAAPRGDGPRRGQVKPQGSAAVVLLGAVFLLLSIVVCRAVVLGLETYVVAVGAVPRAFASFSLASQAHAEGVALVVAVALGSLVALGLGMRDPRRLAGRLEELLALPTTPAVALAAEVGERVLGQPLLWLTVWPLLTTALFAWGWGRSALLVAVPLTVLHAVTLAAVEFTAAALLQRVPPALAATLRSAALGLGLLAPVALLVVIAELGGPPAEVAPGLLSVMGALSPAALLSPAGAGLLALQGKHPGGGVAAAATLLVWGIAGVLVSRLAAGGLEAVTSHRRVAAGSGPSLVRRLPGPVAEELLAIGRDRRMLTVEVLVPLGLLGAAAWLDRIGSKVPSGLFTAMPVLAGAVLVLPAAQALPRLGDAVWLLFTMSRPLSRIALERAAVWATAGLLTGAIALAVVAPPRFERSAVALAVGIPALALAAAALGLLGLDAQPGTRHRLNGETAATLAGLVMVLAAAAVVPDLREHVVLLAFLAGLSAALWQRARAHVPWLLDPAGRGTRPLDAADGLKALVVYFGLQVVFSGTGRDGFTLGGWHLTPAVLATVSSALAGAMALGLTIDPLVKQGLPLAHLLPFRGRGQGQARVLASGAAMGAFVFALGWVHGTLVRWGLGGAPLPRDWEHPVSALLRDNPVIVLAAVVFGPLVEEIIFRALLQQGLRSTLGVRPALLLASLAFTLMHEPQAWGSVLASGLCLAWFFERTGHLGAVVLAHAVANALHFAVWLLTR